MPLQATSGAASYDGFGGGAAAVPVYIEDVMSTWLYTGTGASQTITNGIDLSTKGGLVWIKDRTTAGVPHRWFDTVRGGTKSIRSNSTSAENTGDPAITFNTTGFTTSTDVNGEISASGDNFASWTFREQPKFFDVVTYTGTGSNTTIAHALGSVPGSIIVKRTNAVADWAVYHRSLANTEYLVLNSTAAKATGATWWNSTTPTSTVFSVGTDASVNASGGTYVAYLFAHDAGGFGLTGTDNVISCGSFTASSGAATVTLGYEPQWIMFKRTDSSTGGNWYMVDTMRGWSFSAVAELSANTSNAEDPNAFVANPTATGFSFGTATLTASGTYIYIAIRRGPMKVPTLGTSVFGLSARSGTDANATVTGGQTDDAVLIKNRGSAVASLFSSRLTGTGYLVTSDTAAEVAAGTTILQANPWDVMDGVKVGTTSTITNASANTYINYLFRRAPGFFDEVCDTGTGSTHTIAHNLGVVPELMIRKSRSQSSTSWYCYVASEGASRRGLLNYDFAWGGPDNSIWGGTTPTSTVFTVGADGNVNNNTSTYVTYLFATCAGVSKVGSYTGNGSSQTINCGFTGGARFVMVKATSTTGNWIVADSARGIVAGNDPALYLNSTAAEVTGLDWIDADNSGFVVNETATIAANTNGVSYIFLAVA